MARRKKHKYLSYEKLQEAVLSKAIKSSPEYLKLSWRYRRWPTCPQTEYKEWVSWDEFLKRTKREILSLPLLQEELKKLGILTYRQYYDTKISQKKKSWPHNPLVYYGLDHYHEFFGYKTREEYLRDIRKKNQKGEYSLK